MEARRQEDLPSASFSDEEKKQDELIQWCNRFKTWEKITPTKINLHGNFANFADEGAKQLSGFLKNNSILLDLSLTANSIGNVGANHLSNAIETNTTLTKLSFYGNPIGDEGVKSLSKALKKNSTLTYLKLANTNEFGQEGIAYLSDGLKVNSTLQELNLYFTNACYGLGITYLSDVLTTNNNLVKLNLSHTGIDENTIFYLTKALKYNTSLTVIDLSFNKIGNTGIKTLSEAFMINSSLKVIDLASCDIRNKGANYLSAALKVNTAVISMQLLLNPIGYFCEKFGAGKDINNYLTRNLTFKTKANSIPEIPRDSIKKDTVKVNNTSTPQFLGQGSSAIVYKGTYNKTIPAAIKEFTNIESMTNKELQNFRQEVSIMAKLHHPNVILLYGVCTEDYFPQTKPYTIVMEYAENISLKNYLSKNKNQLDWPLLVPIASDIAQGLAYLHRNKIIHRDLKSDNILITADLTAKISDFGISKEKSVDNMTNRTHLQGTHGYLAPEVYSGAPTSSKTDIYSFGIVLYEIDSKGMSFKASVKNILEGERPIPTDDCPKEFTDLMKKCWDVDPKNRPSADHAVEILNSLFGLFRVKFSSEETIHAITSTKTYPI